MNDENQAPGRDRNSPKERFVQSEGQARRRAFWSPIGFVFILILVLAGIWTWKAGSHEKRVVAYCAQDQVYAEPIFQDFEKVTGVKVLAVYDSEAVKTVGLANRLVAEQSHPQCDVFWGNEEMRTRQLASKGLFDPTNGWGAFGFRSRRLVINTNKVSPATAPHRLFDLTNEIWRGKVALAFPQFGTTAAQFHALRQVWGDEAWKTWCRTLAANEPFLVDGNSAVVSMTGRGDAWVGLTDSDDVAAGEREGLPVRPLPVNEDTLLIPNTVAIIRGAPHPRAARLLFEYLQRPDIAGRLVAAKALEGSSMSLLAGQTLTVNWDALLRDLETTTKELGDIFLR